MITTFCFTHGNVSLVSNTGSLIFPSKTRMLVPSTDCLQAKKDGIPSHAILKVSLFVNWSHHHLSVWDCLSPVRTNCLSQFGSGLMDGGGHICGASIILARNPLFLTTSVEKLQVTQAVPFLESIG